MFIAFLIATIVALVIQIALSRRPKALRTFQISFSAVAWIALMIYFVA